MPILPVLINIGKQVGKVVLATAAPILVEKVIDEVTKEDEKSKGSEKKKKREGNGKDNN